MRDLQLIKEIHKTILENCRGKKVQVLTHWGGDADAVGSSFVLIKLLNQVYEAVDVGFHVPDERTAHVKALMNHLGYAEKIILNPDVYVLVDVGSLNQLGDIRGEVVESGKPIISIDHHLPNNNESGRTIILTSPNYLSTSEIFYDLCEFLGVNIGKEYAEALFLGIYYDTVRLSVADTETAQKVSRLLKQVDPSRLIGLLEPEMEESERIARMKALRRTRIYKLGEWYVAVTSVNAFLSSVARVLVNAGAHVAIALGSQGNFTVISMRSSPEFQKYTKVTLGEDLVGHLVRKFGGDGGGHAGAARLRLNATVDEAMSESVKALALLLGTTPVEISD